METRRSIGTAFSSLISISAFVTVVFPNRYDTSMRHFADRVFKLNSRVVNPKIVVQALFHVPQDALTDGRRNVSYGNVA